MFSTAARNHSRPFDVFWTMNDEHGTSEIDDWPVPSAEVRLELDRRLPAWPEPDEDR